MRKIRPYVIGLATGAILMLGGAVWADVPDTQPNTPDPTHVLWLCSAPNSTPWKNVYVLDASQGGCPSPGYTRTPVVVATPGPTP